MTSHVPQCVLGLKTTRDVTRGLSSDLDLLLAIPSAVLILAVEHDCACPAMDSEHTGTWCDVRVLCKVASEKPTEAASSTAVRSGWTINDDVVHSCAEA